MRIFKYVLIGVLCSFLALSTFGCGSGIFLRGKIESNVTYHKESSGVFPANFGLLERSAQNTDTMIVAVPERIDMDDNPETVFWGSPLQKTQELALAGWKNMKRGANEGARSGLMVGSVFCLPATGAQGCSDFTCLAAVLLLCGGGVVGGTSVGWVMGGVVGPMVYPWQEDQINQELVIVKQSVVMGIWESLNEIGTIERKPSSEEKNGSEEKGQVETVGFGLDGRPLEGFIQIEPVQFQLFHQSLWGPEQLTLRAVIHMTFFDLNNQILVEQDIQIDEGPYTYQEWSYDEGWLLKEHMKLAYRQIAKRIVDDIRETPLIL